MNISEFLSKSYTCYHAVENALAILKKAGFAELSSVGKNKAAKGYYRADGGSLFAIKLGAENIQLALSHTDSPCLRLRLFRRSPFIWAAARTEKLFRFRAIWFRFWAIAEICSLCSACPTR